MVAVLLLEVVPRHHRGGGETARCGTPERAEDFVRKNDLRIEVLSKIMLLRCQILYLAAVVVDDVMIEP